MDKQMENCKQKSNTEVTTNTCRLANQSQLRVKPLNYNYSFTSVSKTFKNETLAKYLKVVSSAVIETWCNAPPRENRHWTTLPVNEKNDPHSYPIGITLPWLSADLGTLLTLALCWPGPRGSKTSPQLNSELLWLLLHSALADRRHRPTIKTTKYF